MQKKGRHYDVLIVDAFNGEKIPAHMKDAAFFEAAGRCLRRNGLAMVNVCLERKSDPTADEIAAGFKQRGWSVRLLDSPGAERNAIVLAGKVKKLRRPRLRSEERRVGKECRCRWWRDNLKKNNRRT